jgi:Tfp pilus assembly protein PilF
MRKTILFSILILHLQWAYTQSPSRVREYKKVFTTYPFSDPNPIPTMGKIYPYYKFDGYTDKPIQKEWTVVELENDYIRVMILPEIGGKIWAAFEKSTGKSFIYNNQVVKFRDIAMRGPWTSGGIEPNYGIIGHTPNCATPVDYTHNMAADGSASCTIGVLDLLTRTPWRLTIHLPKDKAYFTTNSFWYNATPLEQPYYTWMNTGIKAKGNLEFIYDGSHYLGHDGEYADWKINADNGKDISFYENNNFGSYKSYHVFGKYTEFFGGYYHDEDFGMGRYSSHDDKPGKKIWIWGLSQQGMIWEKLLTDADGQYVEVQSGRLFNQAADNSSLTPFKNHGFAPYASDNWTEYWFPVKQTKGFVMANSYGAFNIKNVNGESRIYFSPLQNINDKLEIFEGEKLIYSKQLVLKPLENFTDKLNITVKTENITAKLGDTKLVYQGSPKANLLNRPKEAPPYFEHNSAYGLYLKGKENMILKHFDKSEENLKAALQKDPLFAPALVSITQLQYRNMNDAKALEYATKALSIDTYEPAANYYYGLINARLGRVADAKDGFDIATQSIAFRSAAYTELSKLYFKEKNTDRALDYAHKALDFNRFNIESYQIMALIYRLSGEMDKAKTALNNLITIDPLSHFAHFEYYFLNKNELTKKAFLSKITNEMPTETLLELAIWYYEKGQYTESNILLEMASPNAEVLYWQAFLKEKMGQPIGDWIEKGNNASPNLVFPFRSESANVMEWVISKNKAWQPRYYLGLIYWNRNNIDQAKRLFEQCGDTPQYAPFYAGRFELLKNYSDLEKAANMDKKQWRYGVKMIQYQIDNKNADKAFSIADAYKKTFPDNYIIGMAYAKSLLLNKKYQACSDFLNNIKILPYEGATDGRALYKETQLMLATEHFKNKKYNEALKAIEASRIWSENLGVGKPYAEDTDERLEDWLAVQCYEKLGNGIATEKYLQKILQFKEKNSSTNSILKAMALKKMGKPTNMEDILRRIKNEGLKQWAESFFNGKIIDMPAGGLENEDYRVIMAWSKG